jgi:flavin-dependent dehydrogenase
VDFVAPSGQSFSYSTEHIEALVIDRRAFDEDLARRAREAGADVCAGERVLRVDPDAAGVTVATTGREIRARAVVLACGVHYAFQQRLGLGLPAVFLNSAQLEVPVESPGDVEVHFGSQIAPRGFGWVVPVHRPSGAFARIGVMTAGDAPRHFWQMVERVRARWQARIDGDAEPHRRLLPLAAIRRTYADRVLVVGDAAGLVKPTTGGGIYYSLVSGEIAADTLAERLAGDQLDALSLATYERRWRKRFKPEFDAQLALRMLAQRLTDAEIDALFDLVSIDGIMPIVRRSATFNRHRAFILDLLKHPPARRLLFRRLVGGTS